MTVLDPLLTLDSTLFLWINGWPHPTWLTAVMRAASTVSWGSIIWLVFALALAMRRDRGGAFRTTLALLVTSLVVSGTLKPLVGRDRPPVTLETAVVHTVLPATESFPSGHAAGAAAGAYSLSRVWTTATPLLWGFAAIIAISRVYLGVHYPMDVAAGLVAGLACAYFVTGGRTYAAPSTEQPDSTATPAGA